ncbi:uncharacterized protein LOC121731849 [Aricia agestis]|uniref:uncharacterized protein LOC121731849 n=1 Tax=Aricia agestis TaxID=91739 RepID=UPI001C204D99|nr:uncharacterized protein LOC121731849 [Aricia agestis]
MMIVSQMTRADSGVWTCHENRAYLKIMTVSTVIRVMKNSPPKSGCIHLLVHMFFGTIIVTSFIMILMMTLRGDGKGSDVSSKCSVSKCRVTCSDIDLINDDTSQITIAASDADTACESITLAMIRPIFRDGILPENWLARVRTTIRELSIVEGNLKYITPGSFMDPASNGIKSLVLDSIEISTWREDTFLGLSNLRELYLKDCSFGRIQENSLEAVDDTLALLDIKALHFWNPVNVTGSSTFLKLEKVNLSFNVFYDILSSVTFQSLHYCKILYLNSCKITFIGAGTFEPMKSLELLYLNDNHLVTIPSGLFEPLLMSETIRIALHENFWLCSCSQADLRTLHTKGAIMVEPTCYYPDIKRGITFSELEEYCEKRESNKSTTLPEYQIDMCKKLSISTIIRNTAACYEDNLSFKKNGGRYVMPTIHHTCLSNRMKENVYKQIRSVKTFVTNDEFSGNSTWLRPVYTSHSMQFSMIELSVTGKSNDGVMWFESDNKSDIYCINSVPDVLQVFYSSLDEDYTFCLFDTTSGDIQNEKCLKYKLSDFVKVPNRRITTILKFLIHMCTALACLLCGATCVFIIINKNPTLLKRNKRILLVKHKTIDALVLPPEVPLRKDNMADANDVVEKIFILPQNELLPQSCYERSTSMRSSKSNDASYISALSPTEEQLRDWRSNSLVCDRSSTDGNASPICSLYESLPYYSMHEKVYESIH